jgi:hypothetical protein
MTAPAQAISAQLRAEQVAKELRERFVLADLPTAPANLNPPAGGPDQGGGYHRGTAATIAALAFRLTYP